MSFLYPRTISVQRVVQVASTATQGASQALSVIAAGLPCLIDLKRPKGTSAPVGFPGATNTDAPSPYWYITLPRSVAAIANYFQDGDLLTDDTAQTYKVEAVWWTPIGTTLACEHYRPQS